jgi:hypothetical protein
MSSRWLPDSTIRPLSRTKIRSADRTLEKRCEIEQHSASAEKGADALEQLVLRTRIQSGGRLVENDESASRKKARARAIRCHWPTDRSSPPSNSLPSIVS